MFVTYFTVPPLGPNPVQLSCPTCKSLVVTSVENEASSTAYLCCLMMCILQYEHIILKILKKMNH